MKKTIVLIIVALLVISVAALLYKAATEGGGADRPDAALEEQIRQLAENGEEAGSADKTLDSFDPQAGSYEARVYFCRQAVRRVIDKGLDLQDREVSSAATLISPTKLLQYYTCKAAENLDAGWCGKLGKLPEGIGYDLDLYRECIKQYRSLAVAGAYVENWPTPSIEKFEKKLAGRTNSLADEILKTARPIFARSSKGCEELPGIEEKLACRLLASPEDPPLPPAEAELEIKNFYYTFMAFRKNDPAWLEHTSDFDTFAIKEAFSSEPYCDAAFSQMAEMYCVGEKQESLE